MHDSTTECYNHVAGSLFLFSSDSGHCKQGLVNPEVLAMYPRPWTLPSVAARRRRHAALVKVGADVDIAAKGRHTSL